MSRSPKNTKPQVSFGTDRLLTVGIFVNTVCCVLLALRYEQEAEMHARISRTDFINKQASCRFIDPALEVTHCEHTTISTSSNSLEPTSVKYCLTFGAEMIASCPARKNVVWVGSVAFGTSEIQSKLSVPAKTALSTATRISHTGIRTVKVALKEQSNANFARDKVSHEDLDTSHGFSIQKLQPRLSTHKFARRRR